jgi:hypothetical protein
MGNMPITRHDIDISSKVLLYEEDGLCVAHALDFDLIGCGPDERSALGELRENILAQITLCIHQNCRETFFRQAPEEYSERWYRARERALKQIDSKDVPMGARVTATFIAVSAGDIARYRKRAHFKSGGRQGSFALAQA